MNFTSTNNSVLTIEKIRELAPSVFAESADHSKVSDKYTFIPTTRVLDTLGQEGWKPVFARQSACRTEDGKNFTKHLIRLRNELFPVQLAGEFFPEIVLTNAHNGLGAYCLDAGLFRLACSNGLVVAGASFGSVRVKHIGYSDDQILDVSAKLIESVPLITNRVAAFKAIELQPEEQVAFATAALTLKYDSVEESPVKAEQLLQAKRYSDKGNSVWETFNRVQENIVRGGVRYYKNSKRNSTRAITSVNENIKVNRALWTLTEELAKIKSGI